MIRAAITIILASFSHTLFSQSKTVLPDVFYQCWAASYEEDNDAVTIFKTYRPCNYKEFKPGMYRHRIEFFRDGKCKWLRMAPNDAHYFVDGVWTYQRGMVTVRNAKDQVIFKFRIKNLKQNRMNIAVKAFNY
jgi:hypothetical protein